MRLRPTVVAVVIFWGVASAAAANDRLPRRLRPGYAVARAEAHKYIRYILRKVFLPRIRAVNGAHLPPAQRRRQADELTDDIVHLLLPEGRRLMRDAVFGTGATHLVLTRPELRSQARQAALEGLKHNRPVTSVGQAIEQLGGVAERALNDRLEQALQEDMEDYVQQWVEGGVGLPIRGRPRYRTRPLPKKWEQRYQREARKNVHNYLYWWLRKRRRLSLHHLALGYTRSQLDRIRYRGPVWRLTSGASYEAWAQNRLRLDFKWGRLNWQINRRRLRRRMDQDLAEGTWALARMVKELLSSQTMREVTQQLERSVARELSKPPLRQEANQYPDTSPQLRRKLQRIKKELDPIFNRAMDKVKLPPDMPPDLQELTREHGRRFMREELEPQLQRAIQRQASALAADRRVRDRLPGMVADAMRGFDPGSREARGDPTAFAKSEVLPRVKKEIARSFRQSGLDRFTLGAERHRRMVRRVMDRFDYSRQIEREVVKQRAQRQQEGRVR